MRVLIKGSSAVGGLLLAAAYLSLHVFSVESIIYGPASLIVFGLIITVIALVVTGIMTYGKDRWAAFLFLGFLVLASSGLQTDILQIYAFFVLGLVLALFSMRKLIAQGDNAH